VVEGQLEIRGLKTTAGCDRRSGTMGPAGLPDTAGRLSGPSPATSNDGGRDSVVARFEADRLVWARALCILVVNPHEGTGAPRSTTPSFISASRRVVSVPRGLRAARQICHQDGTTLLSDDPEKNVFETSIPRTSMRRSVLHRSARTAWTSSRSDTRSSEFPTSIVSGVSRCRRARSKQRVRVGSRRVGDLRLQMAALTSLEMPDSLSPARRLQYTVTSADAGPVTRSLVPRSNATPIRPRRPDSSRRTPMW